MTLHAVGSMGAVHLFKSGISWCHGVLYGYLGCSAPARCVQGTRDSSGGMQRDLRPLFEGPRWQAYEHTVVGEMSDAGALEGPDDQGELEPSLGPN